MEQGSYRISLADGVTGTILIRKQISYPGGRGIFVSFVVSGGLSGEG